MIFTRRVVRAALAAATAITLVPLGLSSAHAAPATPDRLSSYAPSLIDIAATELGKHEGLSRDAALQRLASQPARIALGEQLVDKLGTHAAGMWLDQANDAVVVNVIDEAAAATVRAAGATAQVVAHSMAELESVRDALTTGQPTDTAVGIDVKANQVTVQVGKTARGTAAGLLAAAARFGNTVRVEHINDSFSTLISGGYPIVGASGGRCSLGFNTTGNTGVTAGHCTQAIPQWWEGCCGWGYYGPSVAANFPGDDFGLISNDGGLWQPGDVYLYNGWYQDIIDASWPYYGEFVYKSGSTTGLTWGWVYATGVTICYQQGCVGDLAQSDAYAAPGDSGGSWFDGPYAVGLTSGGGGGWTFFQPVVEALWAYGVWVY
jgi:streptogrisin D